ncbi:MAG: hypothetical protein KFB95_09835 [Simkaniaceae bacterium]|nr:MAG: hypothetical protein KFB95_09835 [Simkaniaceae bacterium]
MIKQSNIYYHAGAQVTNLALYFLIAGKAQGYCSSVAVLTATALQYIRSNQINDQQDRYLCKPSMVFVAAGCLFSRTGVKVGGISLVYFATSFEAIHYHRPKRWDLPSFQDRPSHLNPKEATDCVTLPPFPIVKQKASRSSNQSWDAMVRHTYAMRSVPLPGKIGSTSRVGAPPRMVLPPKTSGNLLSRGLAVGVLSKGVGPTGLKGIPNYSSNCFAISAYQLVKSNPRLYDAIFTSDRFKEDKRFDALREFDIKYSSGALLTILDMQKVRTECLTQFRISSYGHQDAYEVLTLALFDHLPPTSTVKTTAVYEFTVPATEVEETLRGMENVEVVSRTTIPARWMLSSEQVRVQVRREFPLEPVSSWSVSLDGADEGIQMGEAIRRDLTEGRSRETFKLSPQVVGTQVSREFTFRPGEGVTIALKRFDNFGNKISKKVSVPRGEIQIDEGRPHEVKGFIVHLGRTKRSGHYVEYQKVGEEWYLNNDPRSAPISTDAALRAMEDAYVFYAERT